MVLPAAEAHWTGAALRALDAGGSLPDEGRLGSIVGFIMDCAGAWRHRAGIEQGFDPPHAENPDQEASDVPVAAPALERA